MNVDTKKQIKAENEMKNKKTKCNIKKQRSENWSDADKELLKELIKKRVKEIENKNTDTNTNQMKKKAWMDLEKDFNSLCSCKKRTISQLKSQWTTIKMNAKKEISEFRAKSKQTGGGQAPLEVSLSGNDISVWLPNEFVIDTNQYDCDAIFTQDEENISGNCVVIEEALSEDEEQNIKIKEKEFDAEVKTNENKNTPHKKKSLPHKNSATEESILRIAQSDVDCRQELHYLQIEAEQKRIRNLDMEFEILQSKLYFYKRKPFDVIEI